MAENGYDQFLLFNYSIIQLFNYLLFIYLFIYLFIVYYLIIYYLIFIIY